MTERDTITLELPYWMVKQLRGCAMQSKHESVTRHGRKDAQEIIRLLTLHLEEHENTETHERDYVALASDGDAGEDLSRPEAFGWAEEHLSMLEALEPGETSHWVQVCSYRMDQGGDATEEDGRLIGASTKCVVCGYDYGDERHLKYCINSPMC